MNNLKDRPFAVIGVNVNGYTVKELKEVVDKEKLTWRSFVDGIAITDKWNLPGTPTFYILDHKGIIRHKWVGSPADYKLGGLPDAKAIDAALDKLIKAAEADGKKQQ